MPTEDHSGAVLEGRYHLISRLGRGGTAEVYLAEDRVLRRQVAVKVLSTDLARSGKWAERFRREAQAVARLTHKNIVQVYDCGETRAGLLFYAMEHLKGRSLVRVVAEEGALPIPRVIHITEQICSAMAAAHEERIVHRDLKPGNVFLVENDGDPDFVKILDFGIALLLELEESERGGRLTVVGQTMGTPEYMSPEQVLGEEVDHRSDIYALGCILYELLTGDVPFLAEPRERVRQKHVFELPEPPSKRRADPLPQVVEQVCLRALEKDPARRFQSMTEMAEALSRGRPIEIGAHVEAPRPVLVAPVAEEHTRPERRVAPRGLLIGLVVMATVALLVVSLMRREQGAAARAVRDAGHLPSVTRAGPPVHDPSGPPVAPPRRAGPVLVFHAPPPREPPSRARPSAVAPARPLRRPRRSASPPQLQRVPPAPSLEEAPALPVPAEVPLSSPSRKAPP